MASPACTDLATSPREHEPAEQNHPEPACLEAQKWIEAVTGKSFGDKDFRSALENGILLCELLSAIKPGLVKKINRLPTPIAGLDNLSVFLRGCEELGLKGSQLFDPGDLQDTSIRANLKDSDCNRKLKNVLNTVFWLGKAASGCASYSGPTLNLKEFEGLLAQMKMESEEGGDSPQKRSVRDSGYDCWDSERSESLSPPRHTRDDSLDSLDSFGSRSQHSPSPDVVNRSNGDARGSDSEADASGRKPDVRKDDMLARRTASSESRSSIPFNQFLPNRANASSYIPAPRRKQHPEEGEQRSHPQASSEQSKRTGLHYKAPKTVTWAPENNGEKLKQEEEMVTQDVMEQRKLQKCERAGIKVLPAAVRYRSHVDGADPGQISPPSVDLQLLTPEATPTAADIDARLALYVQRTEEEEEEQEGEEERIPDLQKDDMMARRTGVFHKKRTTQVTYNRFLPLPGSKRCTQDEVTTDAAPRSKMKVQAERNKKFSARLEHQHPSNPMETPQRQLEPRAIPGECDDNGDECDENESVPDPEKDDMMARRTRSFKKASAVRANQSFNQFLPVPGTAKHSISPVSAMKQPHSKAKLTEKMDRDSSIVTMAAEHQALPSKAPVSPTCPGLKKRQQDEEREKGDAMMVHNPTVSSVSEPPSPPSLTPPPSPAPSRVCREEVNLERQGVEERVQVEEKERDDNEKPQKKPFWLEDELPPIMVSRRVAFLIDNESVSMSDIANEEEVGHLPTLSQSRYERMHEQYNSFKEEEDHWQDDLARWKNRRRSASQELIKKEEERKRMEKRMKEEGGDKRKSIKTYKEILEEKERREAELCKAYRNAATPEEAALVLQRYALRFTISDATLDSLKLPRSTSKPKQEQNQKHRASSPVDNSEGLDYSHKAGSAVVIEKNQGPAKPEDKGKEAAHEQGNSGAISASLTTPNSPQNVPPQSLQLREAPTHASESPDTHRPQTKPTLPQDPQADLQPARPAHTAPSPPPPPPSRPVPLLVAKPYCQPRNAPSGHKSVKMERLVRVNGEATTEEFTVSSPPTTLLELQQENKDVSPKQTEKDVSSKQTEKDVPHEEAVENPKTAEQRAPPLMEKPSPSSGSAISSLIGGRNCIITTTIVTELTQTYIEPLQPDTQSNGKAGTTGLHETPMENTNAKSTAPPSSKQEYSPTVTEGLEESNVTIETPMLNLAKRVNHWVWDPNEERNRLERWQQEQERLLQEQYQREQEKLKKEWEKAQIEVEEEERKHNEEERRILEETVTPLSPTGLLQQQPGNPVTALSAIEKDSIGGLKVYVPENGQNISRGKEDQHSSKLHFFQDSGCDSEPSKKLELWKTSSLDRNPQLSQTQNVKRSGSHEGVLSKQQSSPSTPLPPSPSRCVSGKRLCSGCSTPLGKGAAMIIDTLGLFFHIQCFKCGVCNGQLGDTTAGTDVRIRGGKLSCHECYYASRGRGQPTTL
ncbi:LIM and calponin homology domains-containing protein 1a isoform 5-T5 [Menidia menidia]